jgi:hypothetical protein
MRVTEIFAKHVLELSTSVISQCKIVKYHRRKITNVSRRHGFIEVRTHAEPNWDDEMSLFRKRVNTPNQMETMRKIEAEVEVGKVSGCLPCARSRTNNSCTLTKQFFSVLMVLSSLL